MKFGKGHKEKFEEEQKLLKLLKDGEIWFAWYPVKSNGGRWVWLEEVNLDWCIYEKYGVYRKGYLSPVVHLRE